MKCDCPHTLGFKFCFHSNKDKLFSVEALRGKLMWHFFQDYHWKLSSPVSVSATSLCRLAECFSEQLASNAELFWWPHRAIWGCSESRWRPLYLRHCVSLPSHTFFFALSPAGQQRPQASRPQRVAAFFGVLLTVLQFSHVKSHKPAGPRRHADDMLKWAQLLLLNCELNSYVQLHTHTYIYIFCEDSQVVPVELRTTGPDLRVLKTFYLSGGVPVLVQTVLWMEWS